MITLHSLILLYLYKNIFYHIFVKLITANNIKEISNFQIY